MYKEKEKYWKEINKKHVKPFRVIERGTLTINPDRSVEIRNWTFEGGHLIKAGRHVLLSSVCILLKEWWKLRG